MSDQNLVSSKDHDEINMVVPCLDPGAAQDSRAALLAIDRIELD